MLRSPPARPPYYRIDLAPDAWRGAGRVLSEDLVVLQGVMELLSGEGTPEERGMDPHSFTVAGFEVLYRRDDVARTLTLHRVTRLRRRSSEAA